MLGYQSLDSSSGILGEHLGGASILNLEKDGKLLYVQKVMLGQSIPTTPELQKPSNKEKQIRSTWIMTESPICWGCMPNCFIT